ncbi:MAG: leucyl aminopeptidase, partial [Alphaproteobacteria bacterium]|nr:leucyl aminopeptidase [Alphaproteobacteria bacterium]
AKSVPADKKAHADTAVVGILPGNKLTASATALDKGLITAALKRQSAFTGKAGQIMHITAPEKSKYDRYVLFGLGEPAKLTTLECENTGGKLAAALAAGATQKAVIFIDSDKSFKHVDEAAIAAYMAGGMQLRLYAFDKYKEAPKGDAKKAEIKAVTFVTDAHSNAAKIHKHTEAVAYGAHLARDLMNEPPNMLYPESFAQRIAAEMKPLGVEVEILDAKKMKALGMGSALAVGQGSIRPPCMVVMRWNGLGKAAKTKPLAFVGKGVTFDTGGISIKPAGNMDEMKMDMGGAAAVSGLMKCLATRKAKVNVVGIIGLAENMPSDRAYRPGDIIKSMAGKTIEVLNTDAEGRLVLIDAMTYIQRTYKPQMMIDLATLTGAIMVALGTEYAGAFVNNDELWGALESASRETGEKLWRMPLDEAYRKAMDSKIADLNNLGDASRYGGACNAAGFLERFVENECPWAHLDIAGLMLTRADKPTVPRGPMGFGVRVLDRLVADHYEK